MTPAWRGTRALVTGASSGIGAACAVHLGRAGAAVVLAGRDPAALAAVAGRCGPAAPATVAGDLTDGAFRAALAERTLAALGGLDLLVHSAGLTMNARFAEMREEVLRRLFEINFFAVADLTARLLPALTASRGRLLAFSSITGIVGTPTRSAYAASKHALHGLLDSLRVEARDSGLAVTIACPGYVDTPMRRRALLADGSEQGFDQAEGRRMLTAEAVARASLDAAWRRRRRVLLGRETRLARILSIVAPAALDRVLARATR